MKKLGLAVIAGVTAILVVFFLAHAQQAEVPAPKYFPGESWVYEAIDERDTPLTALSGFVSGNYKMEISGDGTMNLEPRFAGTMPSLYEGTTTTSEIVWYRFPLKVGDTWSVSRRTSMGIAYGTIKVVAKESVKVPGGTFETYKLILDDLTAQSAYGYWSYEYHYSPAAKTAVKIIFKQHRADKTVAVKRSAELASYSVRK